MKRNVLGEDGAPRRIDALANQNRKPYQKRGAKWKKALAWAVAAWTLGMAPAAFANPVLDAKDAAVAISGLNTANMSITSSAANNLIKWVDFSIKNGEKVTFDAKNYLNYVTGSARSEILGTLTGGGNIYLVNPNGILIGDGATVNVGSLYLSTKNLTADQLANYSAATGALFQNDNAAVGDVINLGNLNANVISVEGNNITFKNVADVNSGSAANVTLTAKSTGEIHIGSAEGSASGYNTNGTTYNYKLISTKEALQNMKDGLAGNYMLAGDIDMSGVNDFTPIGIDSSAAFTGRFDGLSYEIQNLVVNKDNWTNVGLFGAVKNATIENLRLVGGSIVNDKSENVGGIVGYAESSRIRNVWHTGTVEGESCVGGIVGQADEGTVIENVYNTGTVTGQGQVGGIVGYSINQIKSAYNTGTVTATHVINGSDGVGGIAGVNEGSIENAYNTGKITGNQFVGGIAGNNYGSASGEGQISHVYNTGEIVGTGDAINIGGIVGLNTHSATPYAKVSYAYNSGKVTGKDYVGGIVGKNFDYVDHSYNKGNVTGTSNVNGIIGGLGSGGHAATDTYGSAAALFAAWVVDTDGTNPAAAWRRYGDNLPILTAFLTRKDNITSRTEYNGGANVGATYTATNFSGEVAQNGFNYIKDVSIVTPKDLTVSFGDISKTYDGTTDATAGTATLDGIVNSDAVSLAEGVTATYADKNAGTGKTVNYSGLALTGDKAKNYNLVNAATGTGKGTIEKANVTFTVKEGYTREYDGTTSVTGAAAKVTSGELFGTDAISGGTFTLDSKNAGTRTITVSNVTIDDGNGGRNYNVTYQDGTGTITAAPLTISADAVTKEYDGTTNATGAAAKVASGQLFGTDAISGGTFAFTDKNVGTGKAIAVSDVTINDGNNGGNYNVTYQDGTGEITRKALELVADAKTITEGEATPTAWSGSVMGFVTGDSLGGGDTLSFALDNPAAAAVGSYKVTGTLNGAASGDYGTNYTFANAAANDTAFTIKAKYVPPTPAPTPEPTPTPEPEPTPEPTPSPTPTPTPTTPTSEPTQELPKALETIVGNEQTAKEYTDTITALDSGKTVSLPTGDAAKQEQTALRPAIPTEQSQSAATQTEHSLGIAYNDIRMPESMTAEALAAALSGEATEQTPTLSADTKAVLAAEAIADRETAETDEEE